MNDLISREKTIEVLMRLPGIGHKALNAIRDLPEEKDAEAYQRGYEDGFREGRIRRDLSEEKG
jgi:flagellar biosynthesis/type III secretory pathway protein FliH